MVQQPEQLALVAKLERPERVRELQVERVLAHLGVSGMCTVCDIGAGSGVFAIAAAQRTGGTVWALEISDQLLELLTARGQQLALLNLLPCKTGERLPLADATCDVCLLVTVYHELADQQAMLREIRRILRPQGLLGVIEFHQAVTPMGPPLALRVSPIELQQRLAEGGFTLREQFSLGANFYCNIFAVEQDG